MIILTIMFTTIYIYIYTHMCAYTLCIYIYIYIHIHTYPGLGPLGEKTFTEPAACGTDAWVR